METAIAAQLQTHIAVAVMTSEMPASLPIGSAPAKSKAAQLLELLPRIEAAVRAGHSHVSIHEYLVKSEGLDLTFRYYELTLCRLRKRVKLVAPRSRTDLVAKAPKRSPRSESAIPETDGVISGATSKIQNVLFGSAADFFK